MWTVKLVATDFTCKEISSSTQQNLRAAAIELFDLQIAVQVVEHIWAYLSNQFNLQYSRISCQTIQVRSFISLIPNLDSKEYISLISFHNPPSQNSESELVAKQDCCKFLPCACLLHLIHLPVREQVFIS